MVFVGIDPGEIKGGIGIIGGHQNLFLACHRWNRKNPQEMYRLLEDFQDQISMAYLEDINLPAKPGAGIDNQFSSGANLFVNFGVWLGWLIALEIPYRLIPPATWQAFVGLYHWKSKLKENPDGMTPLRLARSNWPNAPLQYLADDGKAVGLLLADMAQRDARIGIDRGAIRQDRAAKAKAKKMAKKKEETK